MYRKRIRYFLFWDTVFVFFFAFNHSFCTEYEEPFQNIFVKKVTFVRNYTRTQPCHVCPYTWNNISNPLCYTAFTWEEQIYRGLNPRGSGSLCGPCSRLRSFWINFSYLKTGRKLCLPSATEEWKLHCMIPFYPPKYVTYKHMNSNLSII